MNELTSFDTRHAFAESLVARLSRTPRRVAAAAAVAAVLAVGGTGVALAAVHPTFGQGAGLSALSVRPVPFGRHAHWHHGPPPFRPGVRRPGPLSGAPFQPGPRPPQPPQSPPGNRNP